MHVWFFNIGIYSTLMHGCTYVSLVLILLPRLVSFSSLSLFISHVSPPHFLFPLITTTTTTTFSQNLILISHKSLFHPPAHFLSFTSFLSSVYRHLPPTALEKYFAIILNVQIFLTTMSLPPPLFYSHCHFY